MNRGRVIDIHCHRACAAAADLVKAEEASRGKVPFQFGNELTREVNRKQMLDVRPAMEQIEVRLADMDRMGVDVQALAVAPYHMYYWAQGDMGVRAFQIVNDDLAALGAEHPERIVPLGALPLQDADASVVELKRISTDLGMKGIQIATHVEGEEISSARLEPFWDLVEELEMVVIIHPKGFTHGERFQDHYFLNLIGHPLEETICAGRLIFDGVMERHPGLKIVFAHGGGYAAAYGGRFDHAYHARDDVRGQLPKPPSEYMKLFYFDTMVFEPDQLGFLVERYGADHVLLGTDYPYDMGETDPLGLIGRVEGLSDEDRDLIVGGNAARLLGVRR